MFSNSNLHSILCWFRHVLIIGSGLCVCVAFVQAERLPINIYTTADGLAHNHINRIKRDARGFLWFCTDEGLSRFDGYKFVSYTTAHGLPHPDVNDFLEARDGTIWLATDGGLCRFNPAGVPAPYNPARQTANSLFTIFRVGSRENSNRVNTLAEDPSGGIWCATVDGLFLLDAKQGQVNLREVELDLPRANRDDPHVSHVVVDNYGILWVGAISGLYRRTPDGRVERFTKSEGLPDNYIQTAWLDQDGRLWLGTRSGGFFAVWAAADPHGLQIEQQYAERDGLPGRDVRNIFRSFDGKLWIGTEGGLSELLPVGGRTRFLTYTTANGLGENQTYKMAEDKDGNLWLGTFQGGVARIARPGFITYDATDGFHPNSANNIFETPAGELGVYSENIYTGQEYPATFHLFGGQQFQSFTPRLPPRIDQFRHPQLHHYLWNHPDQRWLITSHGLLHLPTTNEFTRATYLPAKVIAAKKQGCLLSFEDSRSDLWMEAYGAPVGPFGLIRWEHTTGQFYRYDGASGLPSLREIRPSAFGEDAAGNVWIGFDRNAGLVRHRQGRFEPFPAAANAPIGGVKLIFFDQAKRMWVATSAGGLLRVDDPTAEQPQFQRYTIAEGLSSNEVWCLTEDRFQRLYFGTGRALERLDPATGQIKHFTQADGLPRGIVTAAHADQQGRLWFATNQGLARLDALPDRAPVAPPILLTGLRVAGVAQPLSVLGEVTPRALELAPGQDNISVDFLSLNFGGGEVMKYQYKLDGADADWSQPTEERTINFANLAPGRYHLFVRAVHSSGLLSQTPATFSFTIQRPLWQRWWFVLMAVLGFGGLAFAFYCVRIKRIIELERMRTRIATDLHDDIGSSLSQIAILSEVSQQRILSQQNGVSDSLAQIANTSRDLVDTMSDIVWAINPKRDKLSDLSQRMREFASDVFSARDIAFRFRSTADGHGRRLDAETRRQLYLICKEGVNNAARHAQCTAVEITFAVQDHCLVLVVADNGRGFVDDGSGTGPRNGNGLDSMRQRARALGGELDIRSQPQQGTTITLTLPFLTRNRTGWRKYLPV